METRALKRLEAGVTQKDLGELHGFKGNLISLYENDKKPLKRKRLEELVAPLGAGPDAVEETLLYLDILRGGAFAPEPRDSPFDLSPSERRRLRRVAAIVARETLIATYDALARGRRQELAAEVLARAELAWRRLRHTPAAGRRALVEAEEELRSWGVCVLVCEASVAAAAHKATVARELAELALFIAERISGSDLWRARVQGYAWAFVGNARRVGNDLDGADRAFATARSLWEAGAAADPGVLDASRLPDLEASLRRDWRQWAEALALLERALGASPSAERSARILLKKASVHIQQGAYADALAQLDGAAPLISGQPESRLLWVYHYNSAVSLCRLMRYAEATREVAEARELAVTRRNDLDLARVLWLEGQVLAGLGRRQEAIAALRQVREDFARRDLPACLGLCRAARLWCCGSGTRRCEERRGGHGEPCSEENRGRFTRHRVCSFRQRGRQRGLPDLAGPP